jgi:L-fucose isomerase, second N-terminal domain
VASRLEAQLRAAASVRALEGSTFGRIGGRPMGMYTAVSNPDQWLSTFGVDVEEIDQFELVRRAGLVSDSRVRAGREWIEQRAAKVHYDGKQLTPELLERQLRSYHAMQELIEEWNLDFSGIKGQPELTTHFATMDVTEAFLNEPYDWEGAKAPHVLLDRGRHGRGADDAAAQGHQRHAGAVRRRTPLPCRPRHLGPLQLRSARHLVRGPQRRPRREHAGGVKRRGSALAAGCGV